MTLSAVKHNAVNAADSYPQQECSTLPEIKETPELENGNEDGGWANRARPYSPGRGRRAVVVVMGMIIAGAVLAVVGMTFMQGSWWYSYPTDQALDRASRTRLDIVRNEVDANGTVPEVLRWLNTALDPGTDPSTIRYCLLTAQEALKATGDPKLIEAARELRAIIQATQSGPISEEATTPHPVPTLEGLGDG